MSLDAGRVETTRPAAVGRVGRGATAAPTPTRRPVLRPRSRLTPYLFIAPHLVFFGAFLLWPFFYGIYTSLFEYDFLRPERRPFVGLENYRNLIDPGSTQYDDFWRSMRNTGEFLLWSVPPLVVVALLLAVLLNGRYPGRNVFRTLFFAPYALSATAAAVLWWWIFQPTGGLLNHFLADLGSRWPRTGSPACRRRGRRSPSPRCGGRSASTRSSSWPHCRTSRRCSMRRRRSTGPEPASSS